MDTEIIKLSVYGILVNKQGEILMQKRANTNFASGHWSLPGGHVEEGEPLIKAIERELLEECEVIIDLDQCEMKLTLARKPEKGKRYINFFFVIKSWNGTPKIADGKASELKFFSKESLPNPTLPYILEALDLIESGVSFHESEF